MESKTTFLGVFACLGISCVSLGQIIHTNARLANIQRQLATCQEAPRVPQAPTGPNKLPTNHWSI